MLSTFLRVTPAVVVALTIAFSAHSQSLTVTTIAGSTSGGGYVDASGETARFSNPHGVVADSSGNLFVSDRGNHVIRKITPAGDVTTFAGTAGAIGSADGAGAAARFHHPSGMAIDPASNVLYVADSWNHTIRSITPGGVVTTVAGSPGRSGSTDGVGSAARFAFPQGLAVDQSGFVWVADTSNHKIRRIVSGTVTTFAGLAFSGFDDGNQSQARFRFPFDVAVDRSGDLYVADADNHAIRKLTREGITTTVAGNPYEPDLKDGLGTSSARFDGPWAIEVAPNGDLYVADSSNNAIRRIVPTTALVTTVAGNGVFGTANGIGAAARFAFPTGLAFGPDGRLFIADRANFAIRRMFTSTFEVTTFAGSRPTRGTADGRGTDARMSYPSGAVSGQRRESLHR